MKAIVAFLLLLLTVSTVSAQETADKTAITTVGTVMNASPTPGTAGSGVLIAIEANGKITVGGVEAAVSAGVIELYYINHTAYQENSSLNWFGPIRSSSDVGSAVPNPVVSVSNLEPDLSAAGVSPVTGVPAGKIAYSLTLYPNNVAAQTPDTTTTSIWNTYFGTFAQSHPVVNLETGCSCDNSNSNLTDDQNFMNAWVAYANGQAASGYTITGTQQPLSNNWYSWGSFAENPNGTLTSAAAIKTGQQAYWSQLLYTPTGPNPVQATTWNPSDQVGMTFTSNNLIATSGASGVFDVRSTGSKATGKSCWGVIANTISADFGMGLSNSSYVLGNTGGLGSNASGYGFFAGKANPNAQISFLNGTLLTSGTAAASVNGEEINECHDFDAQTDWVTDAAMRATYGANAWNNSSTCNPTVAACGVSTSGLTCPCFIAYHNREAGVAKLNTNGLFSSGLPAGFTAWDPAVVSTTRPMIVILGRNGEYHVASIH